MMATMLVDVDHILANPIYDSLRCSIGFHPLHQPILFPLYFVACWIRRVRYVGIGLIIHMVLDAADCLA